MTTYTLNISCKVELQIKYVENKQNLLITSKKNSTWLGKGKVILVYQITHLLIVFTHNNMNIIYLSTTILKTLGHKKDGVSLHFS